MIPDSQSQRGSVRLGIRGASSWCGRGLALGGLMLAGLALLLVPFLSLFLLGLGAPAPAPAPSPDRSDRFRGR